MSEPRNGIPDDPHESGWHWFGYPKRMEPFFWSAKYQTWTDAFQVIRITPDADAEGYLGPCTPPVTRRSDGTPRVAVSAEFRHDRDEIYIRMNDGTGTYIDGWYWHNGKPVIDVIGLTIPQINKAADEYRNPKQQETS